VSAIRSLSARLQAIRSEHARHDDEDQRRGRSGLGGFGQPSPAARGRPTPSPWDEEDGHGGGGSGGRLAPARRERKRRRPEGGRKGRELRVRPRPSRRWRATLRRSVRAGSRPRTRTGSRSTAPPSPRSWNAGVQGYSERQPSKDVATVRFEVADGSGLDAPTVQAGICSACEGHRFALRVERVREGGFGVTAVVAAAADRALSVAGAKAQPRSSSTRLLKPR